MCHNLKTACGHQEVVQDLSHAVAYANKNTRVVLLSKDILTLFVMRHRAVPWHFYLTESNLPYIVPRIRGHEDDNRIRRRSSDLPRHRSRSSRHDRRAQYAHINTRNIQCRLSHTTISVEQWV